MKNMKLSIILFLEIYIFSFMKKKFLLHQTITNWI